jgi:fatty-acyl-CoA synthase
MTETSPASFQTAVDDPLDRRVSTIGRVLPHLEVKVIDAEGEPTRRGVPGELCTRGYSVMLGYWDDPARTAEAIDADGWMHTGDIGVIDEEGYGRVVGRIKDLVIRGGENIYPAEVEAFLLRHPSIADAAVFGLPDEHYGEKVCAWVRCREPVEPDAIIAWCQGKMAHHKVPALLRIVDAFPMTVTGKVQKFAMRDAERHGS